MSLLPDFLKTWPRKGSFVELLDEGDHIHAAMIDRKKFTRICWIAENRYGVRVGEFPPFDVVEDVHTSGSWHYRDSESPWTRRDFWNRGNGLAADFTGARLREFYNEIRRRYG